MTEHQGTLILPGQMSIEPAIWGISIGGLRVRVINNDRGGDCPLDPPPEMDCPNVSYSSVYV